MVPFLEVPAFAITADAVGAPVRCSTSPLHIPVRRRLSPQNGRAIEILAHAIEYLEDTSPLSYQPCARSLAMEDAIALLKSRNREIYADAPIRVSRRVRTQQMFLRLLRTRPPQAGLRV